MLTLKQTALRSLLESRDGVHLTAYLVNRGDLVDLKSQLRTTINEACEWLSSAMSPDERKEFLEPLDLLLSDSRIFKQMKGNIGLFRNKNLFRVLNIPVEIERSCQVATSFHVKPLLRWLQTDREFLLLGIEKESVHLYLGSQDSFKVVDVKQTWGKQTDQEKTYAWINEWITDITRNSKPKLFIAGERAQVESYHRNLKYPHTLKFAVLNPFSKDSVSDICSSIRKSLKDESKKDLERALLEFRFADESNRTKKNIFQISKAVVEGRVRKLIVTDELNIFGKIDAKSGGLSIHPYDLDHEDDDVLDDLAQMVLSQGGEVVIAKRDEIPKGRPILAILDDEDEESEKIKELQSYEILEERFG